MRQLERERAQAAKLGGNEASDERTLAMQTAFKLLLGMTVAERGLVLCWFCDECCSYVPPGETCCEGGK